MVIETELWEEVFDYPNYGICTEYPYSIRSKKTGKIMSECMNDSGYIVVWLDGKTYLKHRIITTQFIPNDDPALKTQVDHINSDRTDNHISNLRCVTRSENCQNRSTKKHCISYVDELPEFAIAFDPYGNQDDIQDLYFCDDVLYVNTGINYKVVNKHQTRD